MYFNENIKTYKKLLNQAIKYEKLEINDSNSNKNVRCYKNVLHCLEQLNENIYIEVESARGKTQRPFDLPNIGSLMECVLKIICDNEQATTYSKEFENDNADIKVGWCEYEVKACMGALSLNTKIQGTRPILLINELGIFSIGKNDIDKFTKKGKLPYNKPVGRKWTNLSRKLGF